MTAETQTEHADEQEMPCQLCGEPIADHHRRQVWEGVFGMLAAHQSCHDAAMADGEFMLGVGGRE